MLKIYICEDEMHHRLKLRHMLLEYSFQEKVDFDIVEFESPLKMLNASLDFDVLFLDIIFGGRAIGVETARILRSKKVQSAIVYITSYKDYSIEGYETEAFRYLVKPITSEQIKKTMDSLFDRWNQKPEYIRIKAVDEVSSAETMNKLLAV